MGGGESDRAINPQRPQQMGELWHLAYGKVETTPCRNTAPGRSSEETHVSVFQMASIPIAVAVAVAVCYYVAANRADGRWDDDKSQ